MRMERTNLSRERKGSGIDSLMELRTLVSNVFHFKRLVFGGEVQVFEGFGARSCMVTGDRVIL